MNTATTVTSVSDAGLHVSPVCARCGRVLSIRLCKTLQGSVHQGFPGNRPDDAVDSQAFVALELAHGLVGHLAEHAVDASTGPLPGQPVAVLSSCVCRNSTTAPRSPRRSTVSLHASTNFATSASTSFGSGDGGSAEAS